MSKKYCPYVLIKHGMYYAHGNCGYVSRILMAEIYTKEYATSYANQSDEVRAVPITEIIKNKEEIEPYLERINAMYDYLTQSL